MIKKESNGVKRVQNTGEMVQEDAMGLSSSRQKWDGKWDQSRM